MAGGMEEALGYSRFFMLTLLAMAVTWAVVARVRSKMGFSLDNDTD